MTIRSYLEDLPTIVLSSADEIAARLAEIDYPSAPPPAVVEFVTSHAGDEKNPIGIMNIIAGTVATWRMIQPGHDWRQVIDNSSLLPEVALAITPDPSFALQGLFQSTRR